MAGRCRFLFIVLILSTAILVPQPAQAQFNQIKPLDIAAVELLIATPSRKSLASVAGHLYLVFRFTKEAKMPSLVLGFEGDTRADDQEGVSTLLFSFRGLLGHYRTIIDVEPLEQVIFRSTIIQDRSLYRLRLDLDLNQKKKLVDHINRFQNLEKRERYYFLFQNCTTYMRWLINRILGNKKRILDLDLVDLPLNVAKKIYQQGAGSFVYPEYWSITRRFFYAQQRNRHIINLLKLISTNNPVFPFLPGIIDICEKLELVSDNYTRLLLYQILYQRFSTLFTDGGTDSKSRKSLYKSIVELLFNYRDIERSIVYKGVKDKDQLRTMADLNSENVRYLSKALSKGRIHFNSITPGIWSYMLKSYTRKRSDNAEKNRQASLVIPAYSLLDLEFGSRKQFGQGNSQFTCSFEYQVMNQRMGDHSLFAYNHSTAIELLSLAWSSHSPQWQSVAFTILQVEKVVQRSQLNYQGYLNPGYGFTLFRLNTRPVHQVLSHLKIVDGRFVLGLFETDNFRNYLNFSSGIGFSVTHLDTGNYHHALNGLLKLEGKVQLGSRGLRELRFKTVFNHSLNFKEFSFTRFNTDVGLVIPLGESSGISFQVGAGLYYSHLNHTDLRGQNHTFFTMYSGLRLSTDRLLQILF